MSQNGKVKLSEGDWELLLPSKSVTLGGTVVDIKPLGLEEFVKAVTRITTIREDFAQAGVTLENFNTGEGLTKFATILIEKLPDVLSDATKLEVNDLKRLPLASAVCLLDAVLEANIESQDGLLKNFEALAGKVSRLMGSMSETSPNSLSRPDTTGEM